MADTILVVDDDPDFVMLIQALLRDGYRVEGCTHSTRALDRIRQIRPGLVFLDLHMPPPSGWELLQVLRSDPAFIDLPVLIVSAAGTESELIERAAHLTAAGPIEILAKPFEIDELLIRVAALLGPRGGAVDRDRSVSVGACTRG